MHMSIRMVFQQLKIAVEHMLGTAATIVSLL